MSYHSNQPCATVIAMNNHDRQVCAQESWDNLLDAYMERCGDDIRFGNEVCGLNYEDDFIDYLINDFQNGNMTAVVAILRALHNSDLKHRQSDYIQNAMFSQILIEEAFNDFIQSHRSKFEIGLTKQLEEENIEAAFDAGWM